MTNGENTNSNLLQCKLLHDNIVLTKSVVCDQIMDGNNSKQDTFNFLILPIILILSHIIQSHTPVPNVMQLIWAHPSNTGNVLALAPVKSPVFYFAAFAANVLDSIIYNREPTLAN